MKLKTLIAHTILTFTCTLFSFQLFAEDTQPDIFTKEIIYTIGDKQFTGFYAYNNALDKKRPGVIVVHEWWGHNDYARSRAVKLAEEGYAAFALDMYGVGKLAEHPSDAEAFMKATLAEAEIIPRRFNAAMDWLKTQPEVQGDQLAAIGYCYGGGVVLSMARAGIDLDAVASFHGSLASNSPIKENQIKTKVAVFNGADDPFVPAEQVEAFKQEMEAAKVDYTLKNYPGVVHSFTNPGATAVGEKFDMPLAYDEAADQDSWRAMLDLFDSVFE